MASLNVSPFVPGDKVSCQKCANPIMVHHLSSCEYIACPTCNSYSQRIGTREFRVCRTLNKPAYDPVIELGSQGTLQEDEFKVIAYLEKKERNTKYGWREYLLYHHQKGYATLAEYDGHWSLIKGENFYPDLKELKNELQTVRYQDVDYRRFNKYTPVITAAVGEFDWDVIDEKVQATEFVAPPLLILKETSKANTDFYLGEYMERETIAKAFNIDSSGLPDQAGIGAIQPSRFYEKWNSLFTITGLAIILVLALHITIGQLKPEQFIMDEEIPVVQEMVNGTSVPKPFVTPSFEIADASSNIEFTIKTNVFNNWLETTIVLVNEGDNRTWEVTKDLEYYAGYEDGSSWSEGSQTANIMLSSIPKGKYHLNVYRAGANSQDSIIIKVTANASMWRNTLITCLLLCIYPAYCWFRMKNFEKQRWDSSDYSPYVS